MGRKVIIFTSFTEELETIQEHFGKLAVKHNGLMTTKMKQNQLMHFRKTKIKVLLVIYYQLVLG
jgi:superfamily II DNA/RNA helicase